MSFYSRAVVPELSDGQAAILRRYILDGFGSAAESERYAAAQFEEAIRDKSRDEPSVYVDGAGLPPDETSLDWNDAFTGAVLTRTAAQNRHMWDRLQARLKEQLERGEDPPEWLQAWAAEVSTGIRKPPSGEGSGRGSAAHRRGYVERASHVVQFLKSSGFTRESALERIVENLPELWSNPDTLHKAFQRMNRQRRQGGQKSGFFCP